MANGMYRVRGGRELRRSMKEAEIEMSHLKAAHSEAGAYVANEAKTAVPVRTGLLQSSIRASGTQTSAVIRAGRKRIPYAGVIHYGWPAHNIEAQPFISKPAQETEPTWRRIYERAVAHIVERIRGAKGGQGTI